MTNSSRARIAITFLSLTLFSAAQTKNPPNAPLPAALTTATKLFIGNAGDQENADCLRSYNVFYQGVSALGRFQLVADPAQADLVLELHYELALGQSIAGREGQTAVRQFRVVIQDPRTRIVLWSLTERTNYALFQSNRNKDLDETVGALVADFNVLAAPQPVPPNDKSIIRHY